MKKNLAVNVGVAIMILMLGGTASAVPIEVNPTSNGSSIEMTVIGDCWIDCWATVELSSSLDGDGYALEIDDVWSFDFFDITVGGLGVADASVEATLAFIAPDLFSVSANAAGSFFTFFGIISGGVLQWDQPDPVSLEDGTILDISFEDLQEIGFGNSTTVSAEVRRVVAVSEPGTLALLGLGLLAIAGVTRRRRGSIDTRA